MEMNGPRKREDAVRWGLHRGPGLPIMGYP